MKPVVLLGATGYIGTAFMQEMHKRGIDHVCLSRKVTDYTKEKVFAGVLEKLKPELEALAGSVTWSPAA